MKTIASLVLVLLVAGAVPAVGQPRPAPPTPPPAPPPPAEAPTPPPESPAPPAPRAQPPGQPVNIRFDFTIVDEGGPQESRKAVSLTVADRQSGQVRAEVHVPGHGGVPLGVDALPMMERDGKIRARVTLDYRPSPSNDPRAPSTTSMRLSFGVLLQSGVKIVAAQAADPVTDRRVSVEVTATVLK